MKIFPQNYEQENNLKTQYLYMNKLTVEKKIIQKFIKIVKKFS